MKVSFDQATKVIASFAPAMFCVGLLPIAIAVGETFPTAPGSAKPNQVAFERISFAMPQRCDQALALDIDADGDKDIVGLCQTKIVGITMPERSVETLFAADGGQTIHGQAWDADGDGDEDILFCRFTPGSPPNDDSLAWLEMPSQTLHVLDRDIRGVHGVAIGDLDGDGRQDVVTANVKGPPFPFSVAWFDGRTQRRRFICKSGAGPRPHYPVVDDIDGDGRNDVVLGDGGGFSLFRNPGLERIDSNWPKTRIAAVAGGTNVCTADFDGDGKLDILGSCGHGKGIRWYQNPSWKSHRVDDSIANAHALACKDLDDDGDIDIVSGAFGGYGPEHQKQRLVRVYLNDGSGNFNKLDIDTTHEQESYSASIVDVDDDGREDVLLAGRASNNVVWYRQVDENRVPWRTSPFIGSAEPPPPYQLRPLFPKLRWDTAVEMTRSGLPAAARPNIVVILFDDLGYADLGCYGSEIHTPNIDRLAANGLLFTRFYNTSRCAPSRASLLSGRYAHEVGLGWLTNDFGHPGYRDQIESGVPLLPEKLREQGYACYATGKWHLCKVNPETGEGPRENWPLRRGFDRYFGTIYGTGSYWKPPTLTRDDHYVDHDTLPKDFYYTEALGRASAEMIRDHEKKSKQVDTAKQPFFLYFAQFAPHSPLHAMEEDIAVYRGRYSKGPEPLMRERMRRQVQRGLIPNNWTHGQVDPDLPDWNSLDAKTRRYLSKKMEIYAAQIHRADLAVGQVVRALEETGQLDNTLLVVTSDNGGANTGDALGVRENTRDIPLLSRDSNHYLGRLWAQASNAPFRRYKAYVNEGGISAPMIVHWPNGIDRPGRLVHQPAHLIDLLPTLSEIAGNEVNSPRRGQSLMPVLLNSQTALLDREFHFEHEGRRALIQGKWKAIWPTPQGPWELYDLSIDRTERNDLAREFPERLRQLTDRWHKLAAKYQVLDYFPAPWAEPATQTPKDNQ